MEGFRDYLDVGDQYVYKYAEIFNSMTFIKGRGNIRLPFIRFTVWISLIHGAFRLSDISAYISTMVQQAVALI